MKDTSGLGLFAALLEELLPEMLEEIPASHPLLAEAARQSCVSRVTVLADVGEQRPMPVTYDVPLIAAATCRPLHPGISNREHLFNFGIDIVGLLVREYERSLRTSLYTSNNGFLGVSGLLPAVVGLNEIGGISERRSPGWRSQVTQTRTTISDALARLERQCLRNGQAPDLVLLGTNAYREIIASYQPQQRFRDVLRGIPLLKLNRSSVFHDPFCETDTGYVLHTSDFAFHASPFNIFVEAGLDGRVQVAVIRREQMLSYRRFRSGRITPSPPRLRTGSEH